MGRTDFTTAGSSNFDCNNAYARCWYPLCWPSACCAFNCTSFSICSATLFLSFEVRACCDSAVDFTGKKVVSIVVIFQIEVACDFYVTKQKNQRFLWCLSTSQVLEESYLSDAVGCLHCRAESNFLFVPVAQTQCPSTSRRPSLKSPCRL